MPLRRTKQSLNLGASLVTNWDKRASNPPSLDLARDCQFDDIGGLQARYPYASIGNSIQGGGTLSNCRRLFVYRGELLCFTSDTLYSWDVRDSVWVSKGTHLAVAMDEATKFANTDDLAQCDRAELNNTVIYILANTVAPSTIRIAAIDKTTGATICPPTVITRAVGLPRLVALSTKVLLLYEDGTTQIVVVAVDPANVATSANVAGTALVTATGGSFDAVKIPGADTACFVGTQSGGGANYTVAKITAGLSTSIVNKARVADSQIAVSVDPTATVVQVIRGNGTNVQGDKLVLSSLADSVVNQAVGTVAGGPINRITCAHRSVQDSGAYRAFCFWDSAEPPTSAIFQTKSNWVDTAGSLGTQGNFIKIVSPASRAFDYNGQVYFWGAFASTTVAGASGYYSQQDNTYFLYRDDGTLCAKAVPGTAGGLRTGPLPGVQLISGSTGFAWMGSVRRTIPFGADTRNLGYAMRAPQDIKFTFDDNRARRCTQLGNTLYVTGGETLQYDGTQLSEVGFHIPPWAINVAIGAGTTIAAGLYAYKGTWRWLNGAGELDRSTSGTVVSFTAGGGAGTSITDVPLYVTHKTSTAIGYEIWRTAVTPSADAPFYKVTSLDPTVTNPNAYIANDTTATSLAACNDQLTDALLTTRETNPENGTVLIATSPPAASIIFSYGSRIFLAGVSAYPDTIFYSKERDDGFVAQWNGDLKFSVPAAGGDITAIAVLNETLVVFRQHAIYMIPGTGNDNTGGGTNYGPANQISSDVGAVSMESVALTPMGLMFKSSKGWYLLNRSWQVQYVGGPVKDFDSDTVYAIHVIETQHQIRCLTSARMLVWDYRGAVDAVEPNGKGQWAEWTISDGLHATIWNGTYHYLSTTGPLAEQSTYTGMTYGLDIETSWIKPSELQGNGKLRCFETLGEYRSSCLVRVRCALDYQYDGSGNVVWLDDIPWNPSPTTVNGPLQVRHSPSRQKCQAYKIRITAVAESARSQLTTSVGTPAIGTSGSSWTATLQALAPFYGERGNVLTFSIAFIAAAIGDAFSVTVHDNASYDITSSQWVSMVRNVGVLVKQRSGSIPTVAQVEAAITAASSLMTVSLGDGTPSKTFSLLNNGHSYSGTLSNGAYTSPTGEAIKLTGIDVEYGVREGINKRLPSAQKAG